MEATPGGSVSCLVDTNVLSQTVKPEPNIAVMNWWSQQSVSDLSISAITIHELRYGFELLPMGKKRRRLEAWLADQVLPVFRGRIVPLDDGIADLSGRLLADAKLSGHTADVSHAMIAATVRTRV